MPVHYIESLDDPLLYERIENFGGGVNAFARASELGSNVSQWMLNLLVRDLLEAGTRPGADSLGGVGAGANKAQGLIYYDTPSHEQLITCVNGTFKYWSPSSWTTMAGWTIDPGVEFAAAQALDKMYFSDGSNFWRSWNGTAFTSETAADAVHDPPTGATVMCWHTGRMFAAGFPGSVAGKQNDAVWVSNLLQAGLGQWNSTTRNLRVGAGEGSPIRAMVSMSGFALAVFKESCVKVLYTDPTEEPANWQQDQEVESVAGEAGIVGRSAWSTYGQKVLFVSQDGIRVLQPGGESRFEITDPISLPVQSYLKRINKNYRHLIRAKTYNELCLFAVPLDAATYNDTVLVFNARLGVWLGAWTGWTPTAFEVSRFSGVDRLCIADQTGRVNLWKDTTDEEQEDATYLDNTTAIPCTLDTRSMQFGEPLNAKDGYHCEVNFSAGNANVVATAICDDAEVRQFDADSRDVTNELPLDLPFDLHSTKPRTVRRGLRGLPSFTEMFLRLTSVEGWWFLRKITASAFLNKLENE